MMKIALVIYPGISRYELYSLVEPLERLHTPDLEIDYCTTVPLAGKAADDDVLLAQAVNSLAGYDAVLLPGGTGAQARLADQAFLDWLRTAQAAPLKAAVGSAISLIEAAGLRSGEVLLAQSSADALKLGLQVCERLAGPDARRHVDIELGFSSSSRTGEPTSFSGSQPRKAYVTRETRETRIELDLDLDGSGQHDIHTGVPFFDHMLTQVAVHGLFDLRIAAQGDLEVDCHHTVEDVGLVLGKAFNQALGDRKGLVRMGSAYVPMDESLALVVIDLSGRPYSLIEADWNGPQVGHVPVTLFPHFLESFAIQARCNLHVRLLTGRDDHHRAEAIFKAFGRALDAATQIDPRRLDAIPSSKGAL